MKDHLALLALLAFPANCLILFEHGFVTSLDLPDVIFEDIDAAIVIYSILSQYLVKLNKIEN